MHTSIIRITYIYIYLHMHQIQTQTRKGIQLKILVKHLFVTRQIGMFKLPFSPTVHNPLLQRRVIFKQALCHFSRWVRAQPCQPTSLSLKFGTPVPAPHPKRLEEHACFTSGYWGCVATWIWAWVNLKFLSQQNKLSILGGKSTRVWIFWESKTGE